MAMFFTFPVRAQVVNSSANVRAVEGSTAVLVCKAEGYPTPHVTWISPNGTVLQNRTTDTNLIFTNVSRHSSGTYRCNASNELGSHSVTTNLVVWCKYFLVCVIIIFYFFFLEETQFACRSDTINVFSQFSIQVKHTYYHKALSIGYSNQLIHKSFISVGAKAADWVRFPAWYCK